MGRSHTNPYLFTCGQFVATPGALSELQNIGLSGFALLERHLRGDWGDVDKEDAALNDIAVENGLRVMSVYKIDGRVFWVITEADRSVTTILLPDEY